MSKTNRFKTNNDISYACKYHIIWCSQYRPPVLADAIEERLRDLFRQQTVSGRHR
ncbi:MAG TPA: hypothetical protein DCP92_23995 [Nitrospiraceae bacterium]|nr:hypothetical protein [Nitrospiraceae bacterium]